MARANCMTVEEEAETMDSACQLVEEEINRIPVVFIATEEAHVEEKQERSIHHEGNKEKKRPKIRGCDQ